MAAFGIFVFCFASKEFTLTIKAFIVNIEMWNQTFKLSDNENYKTWDCRSLAARALPMVDKACCISGTKSIAALLVGMYPGY